MMSESEILGLISSKNGVSYREKSEQLEQAWEKTIANKECNSEEGISLLNEMDTEKDWTIESCKRYALKAVKLKDVFDVEISFQWEINLSEFCCLGRQNCLESGRPFWKRIWRK